MRLILLSTLLILAVIYAALVLVRLVLFHQRQKKTSWRRRVLENLAVAVPLTILLLPVVLGFAGSRLVHTRLDEAAYQGPRLASDGTWVLQSRDTLAADAENRHLIRLQSEDGLQLRAFLVPTRVDPPMVRVVMVHGLFRGAMELEPVARMFWELGAEVLMLELRNHGGSQRAPATYGLTESKDVLAAAHFMQQRQPARPLILFGVSLGTAAVALAAPKIEGLAGLVLDAPMTDLEGAARRFLRIPGPLESATLWCIEAWSGFSMDDIQPGRELSKVGAEVHVLVIGAGQDRRCPPEVVREVYESLAAPEDHKELWILDSAHHGHVWSQDRSGYRRRLESLLERIRWAPAQVESRVAVGYVWERFDNPTKKGSRRLSTVVFYPAKTNGREAALLTRKGGYPVVVALHGFGCRAILLYSMASQLVQAGYIVVAEDTSQFDPEAQALDGAALFHALVAENRNKESDFKGQLDMARAGLCGHSMGGGNTVRVLADNPGYQAGFCFAPWSGKVHPGSQPLYVERYAAKVTMPLGIVHGTGDRVLAWRDHAQAYIQAMKETPAPKFLYLLNTDCNHINVAVAGPASQERSKAVFHSCMELCAAFFDCHLRKKPAALDKLLGNDAKKHNPRLEKLIVLPGKKKD